LNSTAEGTDLREDAIRLPASPCDPVATCSFDDPILTTVRRNSNSLAQRSDDLPWGLTGPLSDGFHVLILVIRQTVSGEGEGT